jgi:hypothetical protein
MRKSSTHEFVSAITATTDGTKTELGFCQVCGARLEHRNHDTVNIAEIIPFPVKK